MKYIIPAGVVLLTVVAMVAYILFFPLHPYKDFVELVEQIESADLAETAYRIVEIAEILEEPPETQESQESQESPEPQEPPETLKSQESQEPPEHDEITAMLNAMTLREKIGQLIIVSMPNISRAHTLIEDYNIGGFIFFGADITTISELQQLTADLQAAADIPLFIAVDEEGGRVSRVGRLFPEDIGSALSMAEDGRQNVYESYATIGERLALLGFNMNFAPVADIWTNPSNTVIGDRAFGTEPAEVAEMVVAALDGLHSAGIFSVLKHFPGHGDTYEDSHDYLAVYRHDRTRFNEVEAVPFLAGLQANATGIMVGHIATPLITGDDLPAVFSEYLLTEVIRNEWQFDGLIITDALDMRGLTDNFSAEEILLNTFLAGADILLMPPNPEQAIETLAQAYESGTIPTELFDDRLNASVERILRVKNNS